MIILFLSLFRLVMLDSVLPLFHCWMWDPTLFDSLARAKFELILPKGFELKYRIARNVPVRLVWKKLPSDW